ncbi:MAG TPA: hypothetical protein VN989_01115 [Casimicrobiaceae bacterium]|jgi:hypothetical protein|nr:hypothetical protein [Casimicrobiaceae bacterium]
MKRVHVAVAMFLRALPRACTIASLCVTLTPAHAEETSIKESAKQAVKAVDAAAHEVAESAKEAAKEIGPAAKRAGKAISQAAKDGVQAVKQGGKRVKRAVVGEPKANPEE